MSSVPAPLPVTSGATSAASGPDVRARALARELPAGRRPGWWGMVLLLVTDSAAFASLLAGYYYVRFVTTETWPPAGDPLPKLTKATILTGLIVVSCLPLAVADRGLRAGSRPRMLLGVAVTALMGAAFVAVEYLEYLDELKTSKPTDDAYASFFYTITGFHLLHIALGVLLLLVFAVASVAGRMNARHHLMIRLFTMFWYVSAVIWVLIYAALYWSVRL